MSNNDDFYYAIYLILLFGGVFWFSWFGDSKLRYELFYSEAIVDDMPHDCEFLTAPLGYKNCSYDKVVSVTTYSADVQNGSPIISYNEGESWDWNPGGPTSGNTAYIRWNKTND